MKKKHPHPWEGYFEKDVVKLSQRSWVSGEVLLLITKLHFFSSDVNDLYTSIKLFLTLATNLLFSSVLLLALVCTLVANEFLENCNDVIALFLKL